MTFLTERIGSQSVHTQLHRLNRELRNQQTKGYPDKYPLPFHLNHLLFHVVGAREQHDRSVSQSVQGHLYWDE